jgi:hypothetical protein
VDEFVGKNLQLSRLNYFFFFFAALAWAAFSSVVRGAAS